MEKDVITVNIKGTDYIVLDEIKIKDITYVYLVNENDENDFFINKVIIKNDEEYITGLDSEEEAKTAMQAYVEKNANSE